eukprot:421904_1
MASSRKFTELLGQWFLDANLPNTNLSTKTIGSLIANGYTDPDLFMCCTDDDIEGIATECNIPRVDKLWLKSAIKKHKSKNNQQISSTSSFMTDTFTISPANNQQISSKHQNNCTRIPVVDLIHSDSDYNNNSPQQKSADDKPLSILVTNSFKDHEDSKMPVSTNTNNCNVSSQNAKFLKQNNSNTEHMKTIIAMNEIQCNNKVNNEIEMNKYHKKAQRNEMSSAKPKPSVEFSNQKNVILNENNNKDNNNRNQGKMNIDCIQPQSQNKQNQRVPKQMNKMGHMVECRYHTSVKCHVCHQHFIQYDGYEKHLQKHYIDNSNKTWMKCDFCKNDKKSFKNSKAFIGHISTHTNDKPFKCDFLHCGKSYGLECSLKQHWKKHFPKQDVTSQSYKSITEQITTMGKNYKCCYHVSVCCYICNQHFVQCSKYTEHLEKHYNDNSNKIWLKCDKCQDNKIWKTADLFIGHISTHTNDKPFKCDFSQCGSSYGSKNTLKQHYLKHLLTQKASPKKK